MSKPKVKTLFYLAILFLVFGIPVIFVGYSYISTASDSYLYSKKSNFESNKWKEGPSKYRYSVLEYTISHILRKEMSKEEVLSLLGKPDKNKNNTWQYNAIKPGYRLIDFSGGGIEIKFSNNKIIEITNNTWVD